MAYSFNPFTGNFDYYLPQNGDLNLGSLQFQYQANFPIGFTTNAKLYGQYLFVLSATYSLLIIDVSDPYAPFMTGGVAAANSAFDLRQAGSLCFTFEPNRLRVFDVSKVGSPSLLYGPTAAAGNVRCSSAGDVAGEFIYTYNPNTTQFHIIQIVDPTLPIESANISTSAFTSLQHAIAFDDNVVYASANGVLQAFDVSNPESIVLLSSLTTTGLTRSIDRIYTIKSLGSFLYCNARETTTNQPVLLIINKTNPASMTAASITDLSGSAVTLTPNVELFFPFAGVNSSDGNQLVDFFDVRQNDAPARVQTFSEGGGSLGGGFQFNLSGNNFYDIAFGGVDAYILFGTNVSNALVGTVQAGKVEAYGEVAAGFVNVRGSITVRDHASFQDEVAAFNLTTKNEITAYRYRQIMRYLMMMGS